MHLSGTSAWGLTVSFAMLLVVLSAPVVGAYADRTSNKRALLDANSAAIRALKGRGDDSKLQHVDPRVILPSSLFWQVWQAAVSCVTLYNLFMLPFRWAFIFHSTQVLMTSVTSASIASNEATAKAAAS